MEKERLLLVNKAYNKTILEEELLQFFEQWASQATLSERRQLFKKLKSLILPSTKLLGCLPSELVKLVVKHLDPESVYSCLLVNKSWNQLIVTANFVWRCLCISKGWSSKAADQNTELSRTDWKAIYFERKRIENNWKGGKAKVHSLEGHAKAVYTVHIYEDFIVSGSKDHSVKLWSLTKKKELYTFNGHTGSVLCAQVLHDRVLRRFYYFFRLHSYIY
ncbi:F-box/WD repeat-containing protein 2-like isoform X2 [Zophobas morio]|uniref:F-box/WD repeat-containing protein 2-like isoform X2 n=1 Tax=Zophobas morio TaxID=2755281 RepID=UPI0030834FC4